MVDGDVCTSSLGCFGLVDDAEAVDVVVNTIAARSHSTEIKLTRLSLEVCIVVHTKSISLS